METLDLACIDKLKYDDQGLIPAIIQDDANGEVLMMAYMNKESLKKTLSTSQTWFWSRSRQEYWHKGATSGHIQDVQAVYYDCDGDALLIKVQQKGVACHEGVRSCFHNPLKQKEAITPSAEVLNEVFNVILSRREVKPEGSYVTYLFEKGIDKILKKVGEEAGEVIIAAKNRSQSEVTYEVADLWFHTLVVLAEQGLHPSDIFAELAKRR